MIKIHCSLSSKKASSLTPLVKFIIYIIENIDYIVLG